MTFAENLKLIRKKRGFTQKEIAERLGVSQPNYAQYENGKRKPKVETIRRIADALGVNIAVISENPFDDPEIKFYADTRHLYSLMNVLENTLLLSSTEKTKIISKIREACEKIRTGESENFIKKSQVEYSHEALDLLLEPYAQCDIADIFYLIETYLSLNDEGQTKVREYAIDLFYNPYLRIKEGIEADKKYQAPAHDEPAEQEGSKEK